MNAEKNGRVKEKKGKEAFMGLQRWWQQHSRHARTAHTVSSHVRQQQAVTQGSAVQLGGRPYLREVSYVLPKDDAEHVRLNFQHYALYQVFGTHQLAPLKNQPTSILDVGTGTGCWAYEMARKFPGARVVGLDLQPSSRALAAPTNYTFVHGNVLQRWPVADASVDYCHQRMLVGAIPERLWSFVLAEHLRVTQPGGYIEIVEGTDTYLNAGPMMQQFLTWGRHATQTIGITASLMHQLGHLLTDAGCKHVRAKQIVVPIGQWGGRVGDLLAKDMHAAFANLKGFYISTLALPTEQFDRVVQALPDEWEHYRTNYTFSVAYGQK